MSELDSEALELHSSRKGKLEVKSKVPVGSRKDLSLAYTPGVAAVSSAIAGNSELAYKYTIKQNAVAVVSDGSAVLGLGDIGPEAAIPVMEGKCVLFSELANIDAFPICLAVHSADEIVAAVKAIAPVFGGINLEDIAAPKCFEIESRLKKELAIPVMHDDQHATAVVVLAGLMNALKVVGKNKESVTAVVNGAGAAGVAVARMLHSFGIKELIMVDTTGAIYSGRKEGMNPVKESMAAITNRSLRKGSLAEVIRGADVFIGVSKAGVLTGEMVASMAPSPVIFAMANPVPEIMPDVARAAGAAIVATGRSDFPNQINNSLAFPGIFRGALDAAATEITESMKLAAAHALASLVSSPSADRIVPDPLDKEIVPAVSKAVAAEAVRSGVIRKEASE
ncbi:NADP-dependent malic enzyme [Candidatus Woesearchaeota archaeon]|nr:NADP-dependent malic enzyme [Candidatus Woesearchaeota archaeon]